jgi:hypothetical protein
MSHTITRVRSIRLDEGDYVVRSTSTSTSTDAFPDLDSATRSFSRMTRNLMLPVLFGMASFGAPVVPVRRVFSGAAISRSAFAPEDWLVVADEWYLTQEAADPDEVRALNALLHLPVATGLELDLPE